MRIARQPTAHSLGKRAKGLRPPVDGPISGSSHGAAAQLRLSSADAIAVRAERGGDLRIPADAFAAAALCDASGPLPRADDAACDGCFRLATEAGGTYVVRAC